MANSSRLVESYKRIVKKLRETGFTVHETEGCYDANNGAGYVNTVPDGAIAHHYVCSLNPALSYRQGLVSQLKAGKVIVWFVDVLGEIWLIQVGPANHAGTGNSSVLTAIRNDKAVGAPPGAGDMNGNRALSGIEGQHPGDDTPWPQALYQSMAAVHAAESLEFGWTINRIIQHWQWTSRKIDMSAGGGPRNIDSSTLYKSAVSKWRDVMTGKKDPVIPTPAPDPEQVDDEMASFLTTIVEDSGNGKVYSIRPQGVHHVVDTGALVAGQRAGAYPLKIDRMLWIEVIRVMQAFDIQNPGKALEAAGFKAK